MKNYGMMEFMPRLLQPTGRIWCPSHRHLYFSLSLPPVRDRGE
jgi:hypothetical protein